MKYIVFLFFFASVNTYAAWDGAVRGEISTIEVTAETNYAFRIHLSGSPELCGNHHTWAYLNKSDSNYDTYVSVLLAAKYAKSGVTIYSNAQSNGTCKIGHVAVH